MNKAEYVKSQTQFRKHTCHWTECKKQVSPARWGCKVHWFRLPANLRSAIRREYRPGQEKDLKPSNEYLKVADNVQKWIKNRDKVLGEQP